MAVEIKRGELNSSDGNSARSSSTESFSGAAGRTPASDMKLVEFPLRLAGASGPVPAEVLVDSLLSGSSLATRGRAALEVVSTRVDHALMRLSPLQQWVTEQTFPIHGGEPRSAARIAADLNLFPRVEFEPELIAQFGLRVISADDVQSVLNDALQALRPIPMPKPLTPENTRRLRLVA